MIDKFEESQPLEPLEKGRIQWFAAFGASLMAGLILLVVPRGSPWSALTFFSPAVVGRTVTAELNAPIALIWMIHLAVCLLYGLIISRVVAGLKKERAIVAGGLTGLILYVANFGVTSVFWPALRGNEVSVVFTHIVFGLIAAGAYRGLLRRRATPSATPPNPA
jgi:hypothetical protein